MIMRQIMSLFRYFLVPFFIAAILVSTSETFAKKAAIVIDFDTKEVLFEINANTKNYPASLTKIMTLYILFDQLLFLVPKTQARYPFLNSIKLIILPIF